MDLTLLKRIAHKTLAGFMAVWLSGVVFLLCCQQMNGAGTDAESCPLAKMSAHCDKAGPGFSFAESTDETAMDCCGFLPAVFDKARKVEQTQKQFAVAQKPAALKFTLPPVSQNSPTITAFYSRIPDRQTTFVKNCVFRI